MILFVVTVEQIVILDRTVMVVMTRLVVLLTSVVVSDVDNTVMMV